MTFQADIDIDINNKNKLLEFVPHIKAILNDGSKHPSGVYFQKLPFDTNTMYSSIGIKEAEEKGIFKIDLLNFNLYNEFSSQEELNTVYDLDTDWSLLEDQKIVEQLVHISKHYDLVRKFKPESVDDLAIVLALIRPAKIYLQGKSREYIERHIWIANDDDKYHFKKSHAYAYAHAIKLQLNLIQYQNQYKTVLSLFKR